MSAAWPAKARHWSAEELATDAAAAVAEFRARRLGEPLQRYLDAYDASVGVNQSLIARLTEVLASADTTGEFLQTLWATEAGRTAFRYVGAPPISEDDLTTLAEAKLSAVAAQDLAGKRRRLVEVMRAIADPRRFPWIAQQRAPTPSELHAAVLATTALMASQRVQTLR